jgi:hypothetical protein
MEINIEGELKKVMRAEVKRTVKQQLKTATYSIAMKAVQKYLAEHEQELADMVVDEIEPVLKEKLNKQIANMRRELALDICW